MKNSGKSCRENAKLRVVESERAANSVSSRRRPGPITTNVFWFAILERRVPLTTHAAALMVWTAPYGISVPE